MTTGVGEGANKGRKKRPELQLRALQKEVILMGLKLHKNTPKRRPKQRKPVEKIVLLNALLELLAAILHLLK